jgi:hypothetical protein
MNLELIIGLIVFIALSVCFLLWQPTRVVLKEIFFHPLEASTIAVVSKKTESGGDFEDQTADRGTEDEDAKYKASGKLGKRASRSASV